MRGYCALGVEGVSKPRNAGAVIRTAHAFGAAFAFGSALAVLAVPPEARLDNPKR